jgi:DNA-binding transcriptional LysR family regulator
MSYLENIRVFVRVVELGSLSAAGRNLRLSPAVCSHRIHVLERRLGVRLFNRTTRQTQPTEQGLAYYEGCIEVLWALEQAESAVVQAGSKPRGELKVTAPLDLGRTVLAPLVLDFRAAYPEVQVRLRLSEHLIDLLKEGMDAAIRLAVLTDSSLTMRKIGEYERVLAASPAYLKEHGTPRAPQDLMMHECLLLRFPGSRQYQWTLNAEGEKVRLPVQGSIDADDGGTLLSWALAGRGIVMKPLFEIAEHLRSGALAPVMPDMPPDPVTLAVLYPHRRLLAPKVKVFADFISEALARALAAMQAGLTLAQLR